ncbi:MAG: PKD domain-containing protein [Succinivibrionaceae bacterium]
MFKLTKFSLALLTAVSLTACGGGSGSGSDSGSSSDGSASGKTTLKVHVQQNTYAYQNDVPSVSDATDSDMVVCIDRSVDKKCDDSTSDIVGKYENGIAIIELDNKTISDLYDYDVIAYNKADNSSDLFKYKFGKINNIDVSSTDSDNNVELYLNALSTIQNTLGGFYEFKGAMGAPQTSIIDFSSNDINSEFVNETFKVFVDIFYRTKLFTKDDKTIRQQIKDSYEEIYNLLDSDYDRLDVINKVEDNYNKDNESNPFSGISDEFNKNHAPIASFTVDVDGYKVLISNNSSDEDEGDSLSYIWNFDDGSRPEAKSEKEFEYTYSSYGKYTIVLKVSDGKQTSSYSKEVEIKCVGDDCDQHVNNKPVAKFSYKVDGLNVTFSNESYDADKDNLTYSWSMGNGDVVDYSQTTFTYNYSTNGTYTVVLKVSDGKSTDSEIKTITVTKNVVVDCSSGICSTECPQNCEETLKCTL